MFWIMPSNVPRLLIIKCRNSARIPQTEISIVLVLVIVPTQVGIKASNFPPTFGDSVSLYLF
jgi:hypothetical protein